MKVTDLTDPGHEWQDLRKKVFHAVSKVNATESINAEALRSMLQDAADAIFEVQVDPDPEPDPEE